jgi:hypothetical protein
MHLAARRLRLRSRSTRLEILKTEVAISAYVSLDFGRLPAPGRRLFHAFPSEIIPRVKLLYFLTSALHRENLKTLQCSTKIKDIFQISNPNPIPNN